MKIKGPKVTLAIEIAKTRILPEGFTADNFVFF
jgi:hypothetical protein